MNLTPDYIAGFLDGEGCIQIVKQRKSDRLSWSYRLSVEVTHTYEPIVQALHKRYGGVFGQYKPNALRRKRAYYWHATGTRAKVVLEEVAPLLLEKQPQAHLALEFLAAQTPNTKIGSRVTDEENALRERYYLALREAKLQPAAGYSLVEHHDFESSVGVGS